MSWVTVIWSMGGGACLTLAVIQLAIWWNDRTARANLVVAVMAVAVAVFAALELAMMRAETTEQWNIAVRWIHVPVWVILASLVVFVRLYLRAGGLWLAWAAVGLRTMSLILNFVFSPNINFREITALRHVPFLGEPVSVVAAGVPNPWMLVAQLSLLLLVIFVTDATITVWRRGNRRQALIVGGSILLFTIAGTIQGVTITWGIIAMPLTASLFYLGIVAAMAYELGYDVLHAAALARQLQVSEAGLRESEERMSLAAEAAHLTMWEWDLSTDEVWTTGTHGDLTGPPVSETATLENFISRLHIDDRDQVRQALKAAINSGQDFVSEFRVVLPDDRVRWITARGRCIKTSDGKNMRFRGVSMDVTAQKDVDDLFRLATESSLSGVVLVNDQGHIMLVNSQVEKLFGYRREELVGKSVDVLVPERFASQHPAHRAKFLAAPITRAMGVGRELFARRKDGTEFPVEIGLNPIQTPDGIVVLTTVVDITTRKKAEAEALRHREEIGHLSRVAAMGELAASIAHELNQPLAGIVSNSAAGQRFIDRGNVDLQEIRELLADIIADGRRAGDVIRGIQSMVKKGASTRQQVNLNDLVMNVVQMVHPNAMLHSCQLETRLGPGLPAIQADPVQLQQVLLNLIINAFDAMRDTPASRRKIAISTERNGDGTIRMSVRDCGVGVPEEARERVFEQFFTTKAKGLGMGLAIVRTIVESHGGTIAVENVDGGGAHFCFSLPVSAASTIVC